MGNQRFLSEYRIRRGADFRRAYAGQCRASDAVLLIFARASGLPYSRVGSSVSRKVGRAVVRNRFKRLIREAFRLTRRQLPAGIDLVVIPRRGAEPRLAEVLESLPRLAHQLDRRLRCTARRRRRG